MRSRRNRPFWPTHKAKRHLPPRKPWLPPDEVDPTPDDMARSLVRRGLASHAVLGFSPRRRPGPTTREDTNP